MCFEEPKSLIKFTLSLFHDCACDFVCKEPLPFSGSPRFSPALSRSCRFLHFNFSSMIYFQVNFVKDVKSV